MKYPQLMMRVFRQPWLIATAKHEVFQRVLLARVGGRRADDNPDLDEEDGAEKIDDGRDEIQTLGHIQRIPVYGTLIQHADCLDMMSGACSIDRICDEIEIAKSDSNIAKVLFDFRSWGGQVVGIPECADKIAELGKPTIAFCDSMCCSGALWLASQCDEFYATRSAQIGSVGVYQYFEDCTEMLDMAGVKPNPISSGDFKLMGAYFKPMTKEERAIFQSGCDKIYAEFKEVVNSKRPVADQFLQGQIFDGDEAVQHGFLSGLVSDLDECLQLVSEM